MAAAVVRPSGDVRDRLESVKENVLILAKQIKGGGSTHYVPSFEAHATEVVGKLAQAAKVVSADCTRLAVVFHKAPSPTVQECGVVCQKVEQSALQLAAAFYQLHIRHGKCLWGEVKKATLRVIDDLTNLVAVVMKEGCSKTPAQLRGTGGVWSSCDAMEKLSRDNKSAAVKLCLAEVHLLRDAVSEIDNLRSNNGVSEEDDLDFLMEDDLATSTSVSDVATALRHTTLEGTSQDDDSCGEEETKAKEWTREEIKLVEPCIELIKLSEEIAKNSSKLLLMYGESDKERCIREVDSAVEVIQALSPLVDDLASDLPAPLDIPATIKQLQKLGESLLSAVEMLSGSHFCAKDATSWDTDKFKRTITNLLEKGVR